MVLHRNGSVRRCILLIFAVAALCSGSALQAAVGLIGPEWHLFEVGGAAVAPISGIRQPSLKLDEEKRITGYSGCNDLFGSFQLEGPSMKFGPIGSTRRACPDRETALEAAYLQSLERTRGWKIEDGELLLVAGDEILARFRQGPGDDATIETGQLTYRLRSFPGGTVTVKGGEYRAPAAPGSASEVIVKVTETKAFGTVLGKKAGAAILVTSLGGTGSFYELAFLSRTADGWVNTDTVLLGDRVKVHSVRIAQDHIVVHMTTHGSHEPLCCPTQEVTKRFAIRDDRLVPVPEGKTAGAPQVIGPVWQWVQTIYHNGTKAVPAKPENYAIRFLENGNIQVKADCNLKGGTHTTEGMKLTIRITHSTMAACEEGSFEEQFARDVAAGAVVYLKDSDLFIVLKYDTGTMRFTRQAED